MKILKAFLIILTTTILLGCSKSELLDSVLLKDCHDTTEVYIARTPKSVQEDTVATSGIPIDFNVNVEDWNEE